MKPRIPANPIATKFANPDSEVTSIPRTDGGVELKVAVTV